MYEAKMQSSKQLRGTAMNGSLLALLVLIVGGRGFAPTYGQEVIDGGREGSGANLTAPIPAGGVAVLSAEPLRALKLAGSIAVQARIIA